MSNENISWIAPEFRYYEKNIGWYVTLIAIAILLIGFFIVQKDMFAAVTTGILAGLVIFFSRQYPENVSVLLNQKGIKFGNIFYPYKQIKYFWVVNEKHHKTLNFVTIAYVNNTVILELEEQDPEKIREFLLPYIPEHHKTDATSTQKIIHRVKF